jgi:hypothetical protein
MDGQVLAALFALCAVVIGLAVYVIRGLSLFPKTPDEAPPASTPGFTPPGAGFLFFGLMVIRMIGFAFWAVWAMELEGRTAMRVLGAVPVLVGLAFAALYFGLKSRGVKFWKEPKRASE